MDRLSFTTLHLLALLVLLPGLLWAGSPDLDPAGARDAGMAAGMETSLPEPGLAVLYIDGFFRNIDQMPAGTDAFRRGRRGAPVLLLDQKGGRQDPVFASGRSRGVGMILTGLLRLDTPGTYRWQALANDGIRMTAGGRLLFEDPGVHGDRLTPVGQLQVARPGWYPVTILYFQRKGTSALRLFWQPPGAPAFSLVPASVFWHRGDARRN